ncbi:MAG: FmdB family zinc ribbon protein [Candidatus Oleimicrobiaceae bacterium]
MPTYEFKCADCDHRFEIFASISQKEQGLDLKCPKCGSDRVGEVFGTLIFLHKTGEALQGGGGCCSRR